MTSVTKEEIMELAAALAKSTGIPLAEAVMEVMMETSGASAQAQGSGEGGVFAGASAQKKQHISEGGTAEEVTGPVQGALAQEKPHISEGGTAEEVTGPVQGALAQEKEGPEAADAGGSGAPTIAAVPGLSKAFAEAVAEAEHVAIKAGSGALAQEEEAAVASAKGTPPGSEASGATLVTPEQMAVLGAKRFQDLEPKMRNKLHQLMNRRLEKDTAPPELVARWSAAKGDRMGVKQLALLREWAKDPCGFGQGSVTESLENTQSFEVDRQLQWVSQDDLEGKFHYLSPEERKAKVEEYVASAKGVRKHPTLKGRFEYRVYVGEVEHEKKSTTRARQIAFEAALSGAAGASALEALARESSTTVRVLKRNVSDATSDASAVAVKKTRAKAKAVKGASAQSETEQKHKALHTTVKKVAVELGWIVGELSGVAEEREQRLVGVLEPDRVFCSQLLLELEGLRPRLKTLSPDVLQKLCDQFHEKNAAIQRHTDEAKPLARAVAKRRKAAGN